MFERSRTLTRGMANLGGVAFIVATLQFFLAQGIVAAAWNPPYNWGTNVISDLGNTACGAFAVHGTPTYVCSPRHALMNASFVAAGVLLIAGTVLLWRLWPARRMTWVALVLWLIAGVGKVIVGLVPENTNAALHTLGAANILIGGVAILLLGLAVRRENPALARTGLLIAIVTIVASLLWSAAQAGHTALYLGLGSGGMERLADYPSDLWLLLVGLIALLATREQTSAATPRSLRSAGPGLAGR
jgi:hypothetical membrane protein